MTPQVEALGFAYFAAGSDLGLTPQRLPLAPIDLQREMRAVGSGFGGRVARARAADLLSICERWQPDLLVCEELDFGAMLVAERLALPHATVLVIAAGGFVRPEYVAPALDEVRGEHGLPPDPELAMPGRHLVLSPFAPSYRAPAFPLPVEAHSLRLATIEAAPRNETPTLYFTLGTIYNMESGDLFQRVLAGLRELRANIVVTVGRDLDPAEFGAQPANVRIERFVAQASLLQHCDVVVSHGGSGSVANALAHGLPMLLLPLGADQPLNAARCQAIGVARVLDAATASPREVRDAVSQLLGDQRCRDRAERIRDEIAALPGPEHAVTLLERLAAT
jgi:UDP:flavonoid glycosyltransferase YjiC (YdhE family)